MDGVAALGGSGMRKNMTEEKWSSHVGHLEEGGLHGWCASCPPEERHRAIERTVRTDGYATAIRRLNFLANVANRRDNEHLHRVAHEDRRVDRGVGEGGAGERGPASRAGGVPPGRGLPHVGRGQGSTPLRP